MEFRKSTKNDVPKIMNIVKQAQNYFKEQGIDQWQNNYPNIDTINSDILITLSKSVISLVKVLAKFLATSFASL